MNKHTPGPWRTDKNNPRENKVLAGEFPAQRTVAVNFAIDGTDDANARLIAAAPELLKALQRCLPYVRDHVAMTCRDDFSGVDDRLAFDAAEAAIAKATGGEVANRHDDACICPDCADTPGAGHSPDRAEAAR